MVILLAWFAGYMASAERDEQNGAHIGMGIALLVALVHDIVRRGLE